MRRVGLALRETTEVPELALADRNRHVGERRGGLHLLHEARCRLARRRRDRVRPRVLRLQVRAHLGVAAVAQPIPRVIKMLPELVAHPVPVTLRSDRGSAWRGLGCVRGRLSHGDHLRGGLGAGAGDWGCRGPCCERELRRGGHERRPGALQTESWTLRVIEMHPGARGRGMGGARVPGCLFWRPLRRRVHRAPQNFARNSPASLSNLEIGSLKFCGFRGGFGNRCRGITCEIWGRDWYMAEEAVL